MFVIICLLLPLATLATNGILFQMQVEKFSESLVGHRNMMIKNVSAPFNVASLSIGTFVEMQLRRTATIFPAMRLHSSNSAEDLRSLRSMPRTSLSNDEQPVIGALSSLTIDEVLEERSQVEHALPPSSRLLRIPRPPLPPSRLRRSSSSTSSLNSRDGDSSPRQSLAPDQNLLIGHPANVILVPPEIHDRVIRHLRRGGVDQNYGAHDHRIVKLLCEDEDDKIFLKAFDDNVSSDENNQRLRLEICPKSGTRFTDDMELLLLGVRRLLADYSMILLYPFHNSAVYFENNFDFYLLQ